MTRLIDGVRDCVGPEARMIFTQTQGGMRVRVRVHEYTADAEDVYSTGALGRLPSLMPHPLRLTHFISFYCI